MADIGEIEIPDYMQGATEALAKFARQQERIQEAMQAIAQPTALGSLRDTLEEARVDSPALQIEEQWRDLVSVTDQMPSTLGISEVFDPPQLNLVTQRLAEQRHLIDGAVGDMAAPAAQINTSPLSEIAAKSPATGLGVEMDRIRASMESFRRSYLDLPAIDTLAGLRDNVPSWRDMTAPGLELDVTEPPPAHYRGIEPMPPRTQEAGLELPIVEPGSSDVPAENRQGYARIFVLENALRRFVPEQLAAAFGPDWDKHQVPGDTRKEWRNKRDRAQAAGDTPGPLIAYAELDDYRKIIVRNDNWQAVFRSYFGRKDFVSECFRRLHQPRHAIAHMRSLTTDELELVRVETRLLLGAMGNVDVL